MSIATTASLSQPMPTVALQPTDLELVDRVERGEQHAFDALALRYQGRLAKLVGRYINDPSDVFDVVQESLMCAYRALDLSRGDSAFYTWLHGIGVNAAKNHLEHVPGVGGRSAWCHSIMTMFRLS